MMSLTSARSSRTRLLAALVLTPLLAGLAACSSSAAEEPGGGDLQEAAKAAGLTVNTTADQDRIHTTESAEAIALLPPEVKEKGTFTVAVSAYVAPLAFLADDEKTPIGNETDIAQLVADALGLELKHEVKAWADWPLAVQSGAVDAVISNVTVTEERKELYDFSSYRNDQLGWLVRADNDDLTEISERSSLSARTKIGRAHV